MTIMDSFSLKNRTALVTGSGAGLGLEIARALAQAGARVWLNGRSPSRLAHLIDQLGSEGLDVSTSAFDIADDAERRSAVKAFGSDTPDILVNNVGLRDRRSLSEMSDDDVRRLIEVDLTASALLTRDLAESMKSRGFGRIITVTSIAGAVARPGNTVYSAAKQGLTGLMRALAVEYGPFGITSNAIAPGFFATETNRAMSEDPDVNEYLKRRVPLGRWGQPHEIAGAAVFLASQASSFVNGHVLTVDGGMTIQM
ncbi:gluconate 5-dehydrogenase [Mesorhizobium sp. L-8-10]|uniref:SDR family oxidoreductase n=1 Tax=unclassified Mesorhizobium TaxID=325217 RepID=UPI0019272C67|nr:MULTISPECIES: SDR family oxidoreductase [unclassified Mesorhizobium]BCH23402.1 gluconate 5-dehydrogenase [Mesorhizobium sp. L-8-3]BCH31173.1 gluconate 5-dehydrogenase [Mesorhizobium sp. L-8-10]